MPSKRKAVPAAVAPKCRTRICHSLHHPGDDASTLLNSTSSMALANVVTRTFEAHQKDIAGQLTRCNAALQENTRQLKNIAGLLREITYRLGIVVASPFSNSLLFQCDIPPRWSWVDPSLLKDIANGAFDIYHLPRLSRDECLRNQHLISTVEGVVYPLSRNRTLNKLADPAQGTREKTSRPPAPTPLARSPRKGR